MYCRDDDYTCGEQPDLGKSIAPAFGAVLVVCGLAIGLWIITIVAGSVSEPERMTESGISEPFTVDGTIDNEEFNIVVSGEATSLAVRMFLITMAVSICATFIKGGTTLLSGSIRRLTSKFENLNQDMRRQVKSMADKLDHENKTGI